MEYHLLSDELLVRLLKVDDPDAFKEIYERHWKGLFLSAQKKLKSDLTAEELLQNVFLSLWEKRGSLSIDNLGGYLFNALKYQVIDYYRKQILAERYADFVQMNPSRYEQAPDVTFDFQNIADIFETVVNKLPEKTRVIFRMSRLEHKTTREIATALEIPERTVEYHITQSLKTLRYHLGDFLPIILIMLSQKL